MPLIACAIGTLLSGCSGYYQTLLSQYQSYLFEETEAETVSPAENDGSETAEYITAPDEGLVECFVTYVIDGDTFIGEVNGSEIKVRLIGVDTPESVAEEEYLERSGKQNTLEGEEASKRTRELIEGHTVYLEYDEEMFDIYDRVLAYVWLSDGQMLQEILLKEGHATLMTIKPNTKYAKHFEEILNQ